MKQEAAVFGNHAQSVRWLTAQLRQNAQTAEKPVIAGRHWENEIPRFLKDAGDKRIILVFKNEELKRVSEAFHRHGVDQLYVLPWDTHLPCEGRHCVHDIITAVDNTKPRLDHIEAELSERCNLNCKGCFQFSNIAGGGSFPDPVVFCRDLERLKHFFWGIGKIRLQGGEPLLNPDFLDFVKTARAVYPDSDIRLVSNGLRIPGLERAQLDALRECNCSFDISAYPPTRKMLRQITRALDGARVAYNISLPIKVFYKGLAAKPAPSPDEAFRNCIFTHCHALSNGHLAACTHQYYISRFNEAFSLDYPADGSGEVIDLFNTDLDGWAINRIFEHPRGFCRYCCAGMEPFPWKSAPAGEAKAEDWIAGDSFPAKTVTPMIQKALKPAAVRLRRHNQRPKRKSNP